MKKVILFLVAILVSSIFIGCSSDDDSSDRTINPQSIKFKETSLALKKGDVYSLSIEVYPTEADLPKVSFESSNNDIASVSNTGQITAKNVGKCDITAISEDKKFTATCSIEVSYKYNTYVEPVIKFGATRDEIKQLETRAVKTDDAPYGFLIYSGAGDYSIRYSFIQGKMIDAEVLIDPDKASECHSFLNERYSIKETYKGNLWYSGNVYIKRYTTNPMRTIIWYTTDISRYQ